MIGRRASARWTALAVVLGIIAAVVSTYPLINRVRDSVSSWTDETTLLADVFLTVWLMDEGGHRLYTDPLHVFDANAYYPMRHSLAYAESMLSAGAIVAPVNALTGNPVLGYNLYYLATIVLSLLGTFLVVREITGDPRAGLVAGWLYALYVDRLWFGGFLPSLSVQWVPFVFYAWLRFLAAPALLTGTALAVVLIVHVHSGAYHGLMLPVLLVPWAIVLFAFSPWPRARWLASGAILACALAAALVLFLPYVEVRDEFQRAPEGMWGVSPAWYWGAFTSPVAYLRGVIWGPRQLATPGPAPGANLGVAATSPLPALLLAAAALAVAFRRPHTPRLRGEGAHVAALVAFALAAMAVSLGGRITIRGIAYNAAPPFTYLHDALPGFGSMRVQRRFIMLAAFGTSALAGVAIAVLLRRIRSRVIQGALWLGLLVVIPFDARVFRGPTPLTHLPIGAEVPPVYAWLASTPRDTAVLELPYGDFGTDALFMYYSLYHRRGLMNGFSGTSVSFLEAFVNFPDELSLEALRDAGVRYVITHRSTYLPSPPMEPFLARVAARCDINPPAPPRLPPDPSAVELDRRRWVLSGSDPGAALAADGDIATHWLASTPERDTALRIDLGEEHAIAGVTLRVGAHALEYPRSYALWGSRDGDAWTQLGGAPITLPPFASYRRDHRDVEVPLRMEPGTARYLEIRVPPRLGWVQPSTWGVHELRVFVREATSSR
jgi:F5/8 type C domain